MIIKGRKISSGKAEGEAIVCKGPFSFLGDLDPMTGIFSVKGHELEGQNLAGKIFIFTTGKGSTAGSSIAFQAKLKGTAPAGMICLEVEPILAAAVIAAKIPMVDKLDQNPVEVIKTGDWVKLDASEGTVEISNPRA